MLKAAACPLFLALLLIAGVALAEPPSSDSGSWKGRSDDAPRPPHSGGDIRRLPPGQTKDFLERLRSRVKVPADGPRAQGRLARARERAFDFALKNPNLGPEEIRAKLKEMQEHPDEMRRERRRYVHSRWGATALDPRARPELELHARRMARIRRLQFLSVTERAAEKRAELLERLSRLRDLERGRHERAMQAIAAGKTPDAVASVSPPTPVKPGRPLPSALARGLGRVPKAAASGSVKGGGAP